MKIQVIYNGIDPELLDQVEFYGLDYLNFLKLIIISCNQNSFSLGLVSSWLQQHDEFYYHDDLHRILVKLAQMVSFTVRPCLIAETILRCQIEHISNTAMVICYETHPTNNSGVTASHT